MKYEALRVSVEGFCGFIFVVYYIIFWFLVMATTENSSKVTKEWKKLKIQELRDELSKRDSNPSVPGPSSTESLGNSSDLPENAVCECPESHEKQAVPPSEDTPEKSEAVNVEPTSGDEASQLNSVTKKCEDSIMGESVDPVEAVTAVVASVEKPSNEGEDNGVASVAGPLQLSDLEKKHRRAERFGLALQLSEEEKRNSRAARFGESANGTPKPTSPGLGETKISEEEKRKARAERFGLALRSSADDEAKKKARLARFGVDVKSASLEDDKKKARAARFASALDESTSEVNKKLKPDLAETVAST